MRYDTDRLVFSPSDLVVFLDSEFASWMDRWRIECSKNPEGMTNELKLPLGINHEGLTCKPDEQDAESRLIATMGMTHESAFLKKLLDKGHRVEDIKTVANDGQVKATIDAMRNGKDFIYQGRLKHERFEGLADFLVQLPGDSSLGEYAENEIRKDFTPSERVAIATTIEKQIGNRHGQRTDNPLVQKIAQVPPGKKTRDIAAGKSGFGNHETYRQAAKVVQNGTTKLIHAMDSGRISISAASILVDADPDEQDSSDHDPQAFQRHFGSQRNVFT